MGMIRTSTIFGVVGTHGNPVVELVEMDTEGGREYATTLLLWNVWCQDQHMDVQ